MPGNTNKRTLLDRSRIAGSEVYEIDYLVKKLRTTPELVKRAMKKVGTSRQKIGAYIRSKSL